MIQVNDDAEEAIKLVKIDGGSETCTVGFIPRAFGRLERIKRMVGQFCTVVEVYQESENVFKNRLAEKNYGMASCMFLDDVPRLE